MHRMRNLLMNLRWPSGGAVTGQVSVLNQGAGWLEGGLVASFEKLIIDAEMLQMMAAWMDGFRVDDAALALDAVREVGPGGHYFGVEHTLERYETAFYQPLLSDWSNFENWRDRGSRDATKPRAPTRFGNNCSPTMSPPPSRSFDQRCLGGLCRETQGGHRKIRGLGAGNAPW